MLQQNPGAGQDAPAVEQSEGGRPKESSACISRVYLSNAGTVCDMKPPKGPEEYQTEGLPDNSATIVATRRETHFALFATVTAQV